MLNHGMKTSHAITANWQQLLDAITEKNSRWLQIQTIPELLALQYEIEYAILFLKNKITSDITDNPDSEIFLNIVKENFNKSLDRQNNLNIQGSSKSLVGLLAKEFTLTSKINVTEKKIQETSKSITFPITLSVLYEKLNLQTSFAKSWYDFFVLQKTDKNILQLAILPQQKQKILKECTNLSDLEQLQIILRWINEKSHFPAITIEPMREVIYTLLYYVRYHYYAHHNITGIAHTERASPYGNYDLVGIGNGYVCTLTLLVSSLETAEFKELIHSIEKNPQAHHLLQSLQYLRQFFIYLTEQEQAILNELSKNFSKSKFIDAIKTSKFMGAIKFYPDKKVIELNLDDVHFNDLKKHFIQIEKEVFSWESKGFFTLPEKFLDRNKLLVPGFFPQPIITSADKKSSINVKTPMAGSTGFFDATSLKFGEHQLLLFQHIPQFHTTEELHKSEDLKKFYEQWIAFITQQKISAILCLEDENTIAGLPKHHQVTIGDKTVEMSVSSLKSAENNLQCTRIDIFAKETLQHTCQYVHINQIESILLPDFEVAKMLLAHFNILKNSGEKYHLILHGDKRKMTAQNMVAILFMLQLIEQDEAIKSVIKVFLNEDKPLPSEFKNNLQKKLQNVLHDLQAKLFFPVDNEQQQGILMTAVLLHWLDTCEENAELDKIYFAKAQQLQKTFLPSLVIKPARLFLPLTGEIKMDPRKEHAPIYVSPITSEPPRKIESADPNTRSKRISTKILEKFGLHKEKQKKPQEQGLEHSVLQTKTPVLEPNEQRQKEITPKQ